MQLAQKEMVEAHTRRSEASGKTFCRLSNKSHAEERKIYGYDRTAEILGKPTTLSSRIRKMNLKS